MTLQREITAFSLLILIVLVVAVQMKKQQEPCQQSELSWEKGSRAHELRALADLHRQEAAQLYEMAELNARFGHETHVMGDLEVVRDDIAIADTYELEARRLEKSNK